MGIQVEYGPNLSDYGAAIAHATMQKESYDKLMEYQNLMRQVQAQQSQQQQYAQQASLARQQLSQHTKDKQSALDQAQQEEMNNLYLQKYGQPNQQPAMQQQRSVQAPVQAPPQGFLKPSMGGEDVHAYVDSNNSPYVKITKSPKILSPAAQKLLDKVKTMNMSNTTNNLDLYEQTKNIA